MFIHQQYLPYDCSCISVLTAVSDINTTVITDSIQAGFSLYNFLLSIPIPDDTIVETSEGYVYLLEVIGPLHPQDVGRIDNTTSLLLVTINGTDGRKSHLSL